MVYVAIVIDVFARRPIAEPAQRLEQPHDRQPLARRPCRIRRQQLVQFAPLRPQLRLRLNPTLAGELGVTRSNDLEHDLP